MAGFLFSLLAVAIEEQLNFISEATAYVLVLISDLGCLCCL